MKAIWLVFPLALVGLLQNAESAATPATNSARSAARRKKTVARKPLTPTRRWIPPWAITWMATTSPSAARPWRRWGQVNGSIVVVDPSNGRILTMVNQKLGLKSGFIPCSTIKLVTALAALSEHVVERDTRLFISRRISFDLTNALAHSNNEYFSKLGTQLGYDRVTRYARMMGLGDKAGIDIPGEEPGVWPDGPPKEGGMGLMTGFRREHPDDAAGAGGAAFGDCEWRHAVLPAISAHARGEVEHFIPKVKNSLELAPNGIADIKVGMRGAVDYGTGRRANYDPTNRSWGRPEPARISGWRATWAGSALSTTSAATRSWSW